LRGKLGKKSCPSRKMINILSVRGQQSPKEPSKYNVQNVAQKYQES
jgi:hypothetical protein